MCVRLLALMICPFCSTFCDTPKNNSFPFFVHILEELEFYVYEMERGHSAYLVTCAMVLTLNGCDSEKKFPQNLCLSVSL